MPLYSAVPSTMVYEFHFPQICVVCPQQWDKQETVTSLTEARICHLSNEHFKEGTQIRPSWFHNYNLSSNEMEKHCILNVTVV